MGEKADINVRPETWLWTNRRYKPGRINAKNAIFAILKI